MASNLTKAPSQNFMEMKKRNDEDKKILVNVHN